jgi:hypothetical protein
MQYIVIPGNIFHNEEKKNGAGRILCQKAITE